MEEIAKGLRHLKLDLDRIVTSPLPRARRTAEIVAEGLKITDRLESSEVLRSGASPRTIREWLDSRDEERLMIVGHNPDFTELVGLLTGNTGQVLPYELKKGGIAALQAKVEGGFWIEWLATPKLFRRLSR